MSEEEMKTTAPRHMYRRRANHHEAPKTAAGLQAFVDNELHRIRAEKRAAAKAAKAERDRAQALFWASQANRTTQSYNHTNLTSSVSSAEAMGTSQFEPGDHPSQASQRR